MSKPLHTRLVLVLLSLLLLSGVVSVVATLVTTRLHLQEVSQSLHRDLAHNIAVMSTSRLSQGSR